MHEPKGSALSARDHYTTLSECTQNWYLYFMLLTWNSRWSL